MKPVVAVVCDTNQQGPHLFHQAGDKYLQALVRCSSVTPILIPSLGSEEHLRVALSVAHGVLFTGGYSNIERHHYGQPAAPENELKDPQRDSSTLPLVKMALNMGLPILGICRGLQEMNVALGGSLHPYVHKLDGRLDHRESKDASIEEQYAAAHSVKVSSSGTLSAIVSEETFMVNSLHGQAIDNLAPNLQIEATAPDGTIEAVSVANSGSFALAVQWHPEWQAWDNPQSSAIFEAFGKAVREYQSS